jgi:hypothetical protein
MALPFTFSGLSTAQMSDLDANFAALGALTAIPCLVAGTNNLSLTPLANTPTLSAYGNYQPFVTVAAGGNTGAVTAVFSGLPILNVYKDTAVGPINLAGGEIVAGNLIFLVYDAALNSGAGGFHLITRVGTSSTPLSATTSVVTVGAVTFSAAAMSGNGTGYGIIARGGTQAGGFSDTTPTAALLLAAFPGAVIGSTFQTLLSNTTADTETLLAGSGVTVTGTATVAAGATRLFHAVFTAVGASPTVIFYG